MERLYLVGRRNMERVRRKNEGRNKGGEVVNSEVRREDLKL